MMFMYFITQIYVCVRLGLILNIRNEFREYHDRYKYSKLPSYIDMVFKYWYLWSLSDFERMLYEEN